MFTGVDFEKAIDYYRKGKEVIVLDRNSCGLNGKTGYDTFPFRELFENLDFLVDIPAVENPEFGQAVQKMIGNPPSPEQIIEAVHETQDISDADTFGVDIPDTGVRKNWMRQNRQNRKHKIAIRWSFLVGNQVPRKCQTDWKRRRM